MKRRQLQSSSSLSQLYQWPRVTLLREAKTCSYMTCLIRHGSKKRQDLPVRLGEILSPDVNVESMEALKTRTPLSSSDWWSFAKG